MRARPLRAAVLALAAAGMMLSGCASNEPYSAPTTPAGQRTRAPVVAPSGPGSPWWWPLPNSWWPIQPWGEPLNR